MKYYLSTLLLVSGLSVVADAYEGMSAEEKGLILGIGSLVCNDLRQSL